jgi:putative addiction module component (TIGR02574 family)
LKLPPPAAAVAVSGFELLDCYDLPMDAETIRREALSLSAEERAELAEQLLSSLEPLSEGEMEALWFAEAARRAAEIDSGKAKRYSADGVREQARSLLR